MELLGEKSPMHISSVSSSSHSSSSHNHISRESSRDAPDPRLVTNGANGGQEAGEEGSHHTQL